jgi:hypothetical protein
VMMLMACSPMGMKLPGSFIHEHSIRYSRNEPLQDPHSTASNNRN